MGAIQIVGVPEEVLKDPRVEQAVENLNQGPERQAADTLTKTLQNGIEKYGLKVRPLSLTVIGPWLAQMAAMQLPKEEELPAMIFLLCADKRKVYEALQAGRTKGWIDFMVIASDWVENSGIPLDLSAETLEAVGATFAMSNKLIGGGNDDGKKA